MKSSQLWLHEQTIMLYIICVWTCSTTTNFGFSVKHIEMSEVCFGCLSNYAYKNHCGNKVEIDEKYILSLNPLFIYTAGGHTFDRY
jgi:hypothetical protein